MRQWLAFSLLKELLLVLMTRLTLKLSVIRPKMTFQAIAKEISKATGTPFQIETKRAIGGGSINDAYLLSGSGRSYFVKLNRPNELEMFAAEADGLIELENANAIKVPQAICWGRNNEASFIVMNYIAMGRAKASSHQDLGEQLASMHRCTDKQFGWHRDNTIGATHQPNHKHHDWLEFYRKNRLGYQLSLAEQNGYGRSLQKDGERLLADLDAFFSDYQPSASLLHGDLWSGNYGFDKNGTPVIFDPAVYFGDREADIAMTELFGGFSGDFYDAYNDAYPLDPGYQTRKTLYNLYHILNHLNLFGSGYLGQSQNMIQRLLAEL